MTKINFKMLTLAREARGYTQTQLVNELHIQSQGNYSRMEKGILPVPDDLLLQISETLRFPVSFFSRSEPLVTQSEYFYRKKASMGKKELYKLEASFDLIRFWFNDLLKEVDIPNFNFPELAVDGAGNTPEVIAKKTRIHLNVPKGPIDHLIRLIEKNGIILYFLYDAPPEFDGTTIITQSNHKIIVVNGSMPNYRKRFTIGHEMAHIIMHMPSSSYLEQYIDTENEANRFASEFLMPEEEIRKDLMHITYSKLADLKSYWKAAKSSLIRRASDLGLISREKYTSLMIELSRYNERRAEKTDVELDEPTLFTKIINAFLNEMGYTDEQLREILSLHEEDYSRHILRNGQAVRKLKIII